jgi:AraC-like DNA-binding protein
MEYGAEVEADGDIEGWTLIFHPDLIRSHDLSAKINQYSFFNYELSEALHLSDKERMAIEDIIGKIINEYSQNLDHYSHHLIVSNIQLLLDYCLRFYDRQFLIRSNLNVGIIAQFEKELRAYYQSDKVAQHGLPTVAYLGKILNKSPHYLSDLLKKETGKTAQEHIHLFILEIAKNNLLNSSTPISEIAYKLGFDYPQYFSNLFKSKIGQSPSEYRRLG